jgi:hypothetical protein
MSKLTLQEIREIDPDIKDMDRAIAFDVYKNGNNTWSHGNGSPIEALATKQSKLITKEKKMIRRAKATILIWGYEDYNSDHGIENMWRPFEQGLRRMGFSTQKINIIKNYKPIDDLTLAALDELADIYSED